MPKTMKAKIKTKIAPKTTAKETTFRLYAPNAKKVTIAGTFNNWDDKKIAAKKDSKGNWIVAVLLKSGKYEYKFVVDGAWITDPTNINSVSNSLGSTNSIVEVL